MKVEVGVRLDGLVRALRGLGHALAETAERQAIPDARRSANADSVEPRGDGGEERR